MTINDLINEIEQVIHKVDLINRPFVLFIHPEDYKDLESRISEIEDKAIIEINPFVEVGTPVLVKREELEKTKFDF